MFLIEKQEKYVHYVIYTRKRKSYTIKDKAFIIIHYIYLKRTKAARGDIKMKKRFIYKNLGAALIFCGVLFNLKPVMAAETLPAAPATAVEDQAVIVPPVDYETALLQQAQMEIVQQGLPLHKYHIINILGDSITEGIGASSIDKAYPSVIARLTGAKVNNYGLSCSRITDIVSDNSNPASFIDRMYNMSKYADLIIVFGSANDFWFGDCPIGSSSDTQTDTFYGALNTMIKYLKSAYPNADIVFLTSYQQSKDADETHSYKRSTYGNFGTGTMSDYRKAILDRCQYYGVPVLDLYADYELNTVDNREALEKYGQYLCDGCHLNDAGYNLLARKIYKFIMQDLNCYVPEYVNINGIVFETAALPGLIKNGSFVLPDGSVLVSKPGFEVDAAMPLQQVYQNLIVSAYY